MIGGFARRLIDLMERHLGSDMTYLRVLHRASPRGFSKFLKATALARHCEAVPEQVAHAARVTSFVFEDCGPCLQIALDQARASGMADATLLALLAGDVDQLPQEIAQANRFARAILTKSTDLDQAREAVRQRWGDRGVVDLTMATQGSRLYPMIKVGLGFAQSCQLVELGATQVMPVRTMS